MCEEHQKSHRFMKEFSLGDISRNDKAFLEKNDGWSIEEFSQDSYHPYRGFTALAMPLVCPGFYWWPSVDFTSCGYRC